MAGELQEGDRVHLMLRNPHAYLSRQTFTISRLGAAGLAWITSERVDSQLVVYQSALRKVDTPTDNQLKDHP